MSKALIAITTFLIVVLSAGVLAEECVPNYKCEPWSECEDGLKTRTCIDTECGKRDVVERGFCENPDCIPKISCDSIGECTYTDKTDDLIKGEINFGGYRLERCKDENGCIPSFLREIPCEDSYGLQLSPVVVCEEPLLSVREKGSGKEIATIQFSPWVEEGKFNLAFVQGETPEYCPHCYNAIKDEDRGEEGIDCGGPNCTPCIPERRWILQFAIALFWSGSAVFGFLSFRQYRIIKKQKQQLLMEEQQWE